jgi:hypothetical protein
METTSEFRIRPPQDILSAARTWLEPVRAALGPHFKAAYLTGSVLTQGFEPKKSRVNLLIVARELNADQLDRVAKAIPAAKRGAPHFDPLFMTERNIEKSLDTFPIEWLEIQERNLLLEGDDFVGLLQVPRGSLRLQCEHELRGKHVQIRQAYLHHHGNPEELREVLSEAASGFATLFRTLLRMRDEPVPATTAHVIERVAEVFGLDAQGLLGPHLVRYAGGQQATMIPGIYRAFLAQLDRLVIAIDQLRTA